MPEFIKPELSELSYVRKLLNSKNTMSWLGQTYSFNEEKWPGFYSRYVEGDPSEKFFRLIWCPGCNDFVGAAAYIHNPATDQYEVKLLIDSARRYCGYGRWGINQLKTEARQNGIRSLWCRVRSDNTAWAFLEDEGFTREKEEDNFYYELCRL